MNVETMQNTVCRALGLEHPATLYFFEECERNADDPFLIEVAFWFALGWNDGE